MQYAQSSSSSEDVDDGVLDQRDEDEQQAHRHPDVDRLDVGHTRHRRVDDRRLGGRRQHRQQADGRREWSVVTSGGVSRPMDTRAGLASTLIQNETHDSMTTSMLGT